MADEGDRGKAMEEEHLRRALSNRKRVEAAGESRTHCEDCGEPIPEARRQAVPGCRRCVTCQKEFDDEFGWY